MSSESFNSTVWSFVCYHLIASNPFCSSVIIWQPRIPSVLRFLLSSDIFKSTMCLSVVIWQIQFHNLFSCCHLTASNPQCSQMLLYDGFDSTVYLGVCCHLTASNSQCVQLLSSDSFDSTVCCCVCFHLKALSAVYSWVCCYPMDSNPLRVHVFFVSFMRHRSCALRSLFTGICTGLVTLCKDT